MGKLRTEFTSPIAKSTSHGVSDMTFFACCYSVCYMKSVIVISYCNVECEAGYCRGKYITPCWWYVQKKMKKYTCVLLVSETQWVKWLWTCLKNHVHFHYTVVNKAFFFIFFLLIVISLQIMEAMALHLESSYEKLYRWSQGEPVIPLLEQNYFCQWSIQTCSWNFLQLFIVVPHNNICKIHWTLSPALTVILLQIVMVSLGTHPVKNHESQSRTSESQFRKTRSTKLKILGPLQRM